MPTFWADMRRRSLALAFSALAACGEMLQQPPAADLALLVADDVGNTVWRVSARQ
jgi:hypothetical protein